MGKYPEIYRTREKMYFLNINNFVTQTAGVLYLQTSAQSLKMSSNKQAKDGNVSTEFYFFTTAN